MARYLVLDIETVPDRTLYPVDAVPFPPLHAHRPIVMGGLTLDADYTLEDVFLFGDGQDERGMLQDFSDRVGAGQPDLVTYNGRSFDLPVIVLRSLRFGVPLRWYYQGTVRQRGDDKHLDLCDLLSDHGAARSTSLDAVARLIGLPGKLGMDGSQVEGAFQAGQLESIKRYCLADVAQTALLFLRFRLLQGVLDAERYRVAAAGLVDGLRCDQRLDDLVAAIDGQRLLLAAA